jgi:hypothetical protein
MSELRSAIDGLGAIDVADLPAPALGEHLQELMEARNKLDGQIERALAVFDARGYCETDGAASTASWLRGRCRVSGSEASTRVKTARGLRELPATAAALEAGAITLSHAQAITMLASDTDVRATQDVEEQLVALAAMIDPVRFSVELRRLRETFKRDGADGNTEDDSEDKSYRGVSCVASFQGRFNLNGWLPPEGGALLKAALDSLARPVPGDQRTHAQRYADALVEMARRLLNGGDLPAKNGVRPHLFLRTTAQPNSATNESATIDPTASEAVADGDAKPASGLLPLRLTDGVVVGGGALSDQALARLACDATIAGVLFGPDGHVLNLGRSKRLVSPGQWRALLLRDGGCVFPGHDCPPAFTEAHHLRSWLAGGPTDLWNLAAVCTYGHELLHEGGFTLSLNADNRWVLERPDGGKMIGLPLGQTQHTNIASLERGMLNGPRGPCGD